MSWDRLVSIGNIQLHNYHLPLWQTFLDGGILKIFFVLAVSLVSCSILKQGAWSLDVLQSHPLCRTCLANTMQASSAVLGWPGDGDCYLMRGTQAGMRYRVFSHKGAKAGRQLWKSYWFHSERQPSYSLRTLKVDFHSAKWWKFSWSLSHLKSEKYY